MSETSTITIAGHQFTVPRPYTEGHPLTENEAGALNQVFAENLRNNFAKKVKEGTEANVGIETLQAQLDEYAAEYKFGRQVSGGGGTAVRGDPVESEARALAKSQISAYLKTQKKSIKDVPADKLAAAIDGLLERDPSIRETAQRRVDEKRALQSGNFDGLDLTGTEADASDVDTNGSPEDEAVEVPTGRKARRNAA